MVGSEAGGPDHPQVRSPQPYEESLDRTSNADQYGDSVRDRGSDGEVGPPLVYFVCVDSSACGDLSARLAAAGMEVGCLDSADALLAQSLQRPPNCVVYELKSPGPDGSELMRRLAKESISGKVIFLAERAEVTAAVETMKAGAFDFLVKPFRSGELLQRVRTAVQLDAAHRAEVQELEATRRALASLTSEERAMLDMMIAGEENREVSRRLDISLRTVYSRRNAVLEKMGVRSRVELLKKIIRYQIAGDGKAR